MEAITKSFKNIFSVENEEVKKFFNMFTARNLGGGLGTVAAFTTTGFLALLTGILLAVEKLQEYARKLEKIGDIKILGVKLITGDEESGTPGDIGMTADKFAEEMAKKAIKDPSIDLYGIHEKTMKNWLQMMTESLREELGGELKKVNSNLEDIKANQALTQ
jgi:hypothetical protein